MYTGQGSTIKTLGIDTLPNGLSAEDIALTLSSLGYGVKQVKGNPDTYLVSYFSNGGNINFGHVESFKKCLEGIVELTDHALASVNFIFYCERPLPESHYNGDQLEEIGGMVSSAQAILYHLEIESVRANVVSVNTLGLLNNVLFSDWMAPEAMAIRMAVITLICNEIKRLPNDELGDINLDNAFCDKDDCTTLADVISIIETRKDVGWALYVLLSLGVTEVEYDKKNLTHLTNLVNKTLDELIVNVKNRYPMALFI